jgi:ABC-type transporter Mla MlaB component
VGIFSLFGKKESQPAAKPGADATARKKREAAVRAAEPADEGLREQLAQDQRQVARATALKIDAIESEMSSEFVRPAPRQSHAPAPVPLNPPSREAVPPVEPPAATPTIGAAMSTTAFLLDDVPYAPPPADAPVEDVPLFEEAAILFANGQTQMVEHVLVDGIESDALGPASITAWAMLFDLYQITGDQVQFEALSIAYASRFETSPPAWMPFALAETTSTVARSAAVASVAFSGKLDAGIVKTLEKARALSEKHTSMRLEFIRISEVDPIGCGLLLRVLRQLQKSGIDLILVGAPELVDKIRSILEVGRRDETEAPWLLLMELLALLNRETAFEEASIDYCVTFEVSPPAFVPPKNKVTTAMEEPAPAVETTDVYVMPAVIEGRTDALVAALGAFASAHNPARVDCTRLARVDVNAAGQLLAGLAPISGDGRVIEFFNVNHLVAALFKVLGLKQVIRVVTRKI